MNLFFSLLGKCKKLFWGTLAISIIFCVLSVITPTISGEVVNRVIDQEQGGQISKEIFTFFIICMLQLLFSVWNEYAQKRFLRTIKKEMRNSAFYSFSRKINLKRDDISSFTSFINNDIPCAAEQYCMGVVDIASCICLLICTSLSLFYLHYLLASTIIIISILIVLLPKMMRKKASDSRQRYTDSLAEYNTYMESYLKGTNVIRAYCYHKRANDFIEKKNIQVREKEGMLSRYQVEVYSLTSVLQIAKTFLIFIFGIFLIHQDAIKIGDLIVAVQLAGNIAAPIEVLAYTLHSRNEAKPLVDRYIAMTTQKNEETAGQGKMALTSVDSGIVVDDVSYERNGIPILKNLSLNFHGGNKYMICGKSGVGKSTLLRLLSRFGDGEYKGVISIGGVDIRKFEAESFYEKIGVVFQEPYLFWTTIEENILLGRDIPQERFRRILKGLHIEYLIERLKDQELNVENIDTLSGGEKQRIALARAMAGEPQVYLLDEAASALDPENTYAVEKLLLEEKAMIINVCHKPVEELQAQYDEVILFS